MPRIRVVGKDDRVRSVRVKAENIGRYAPIRARNPATGRLRTVYVRQADEIVVREDALDEEARDALGLEPGFVTITVTAGTEYTDTAPGNDALFIDASFSVTVQSENVEAAQEAIEEALKNVLWQSGLPAEGVKIGFDTDAAIGPNPGVQASRVRLGRRRDRMRSYPAAEGAAQRAIEAAIAEKAKAALPARTVSEATRRLTAKQDATGRWRDSRGRYVKPPSSVVVL